MFDKSNFKHKIIWLGLMVAILMALAPVIAQAQFDINQGIVGNLFNEQCRVKGDCGFCDWIDLFVVLQKVILSLFGGLALVLLVWGGQGLITASGNEENIKKAKDLIGSTILGVVIILAGYFLVNVVLVILLTKPQAGSLPTDQLFNANWVTAFCKDPAGPEYCAEQKKLLGSGFKDGEVACGSTSNGAKVCRGTACVPNCLYAAQTDSKILGCKSYCNTANNEVALADYFCPFDVVGTAPQCCKKL